ncbi:MAG: hypothetical protein U0528_15975 [Anaerolineae bacterium]
MIKINPRPLPFILILCFVVILLIIAGLNDALRVRVSAMTASAAAATKTVTPLPPNFSLLPSFTPSYACELENVDVFDAQLCRNEKVEETSLAEDTGSVLIQRHYHMGAGCWSGISSDTYELRACDRTTGKTKTLTEHLIPILVPSPDGKWLAYATFQWLNSNNGAIAKIDVYRVSRDGATVQQLDTNGLPERTVGIDLKRWSTDGNWLEMQLWDGTENGWHAHRLSTDGKGIVQTIRQS